MKPSILRTMKRIASVSSIIAIGSLALSLASLPYAGVLYVLAFSASLVAMLATDYAPRSPRWEPRSLKVDASLRKAQSLQLAA